MRNLGLILSFLVATVLPTNGLALGLGEIEVNSFLNQPLKAEIEVISARAGEIDNLIVGLASRDAFTRAGLSRPGNLSDLRFSVQKSDEGDSAVILVTTKSAVKEPFLNFLVEADWSKGRLLREFTVLLDPPFYADSPAPAPKAVVKTPQPIIEQPAAPKPIVDSESVAEPLVGAIEIEEVTEVATPIVETPIAENLIVENEEPTFDTPIALSDEDLADLDLEPELSLVEPELQMLDQQFESSSQYQPEPLYEDSELQMVEMSTDDIFVNKDDTLWSIASGLQSSGYSMSQIMLAIQRANPESFGDSNINNMKVGSVLRIPDSNEYGEINEQQAYAQVLEQNGLWDDYVARVTGRPAVAIKGESSSTSSRSAAEQSGELSLVTPGDGQSDAAGLLNEGDDANETRVKLALAEEELDASRVENRDLESRIAELEARLSKFEELEKMVKIEDDSLAQLQAKKAAEADEAIRQMEEEAARQEASAGDSLSEVIKSTDEDALLDELLKEETNEIESGFNIEPENTLTEMPDVSEPSMPLASDDNLEQSDEVSPPPVPVIVTEPATTSPSIFDGIIPPGVLDMLPSMSDVMPSMDSLALDPIMLGGIGGILLLLIGLLIYKRKKSAGDDEDDILINDPIFVEDADDEEDLTPIHLAEGAFEGLGLEDESDFSLPQETGITVSGDEDDIEDFSKTSITSQVDMPEAEEPESPAGEQDDILNEADVYLAYNLYDNAEDLLKQSIDANPERADYRSKLLDTHFATKNVEAFVDEAQKLKSMGSAGSRYWDRVMVMGYELAPTNDLFSAAKDSNLSAADLEIAKPAAADFDLGSNDDDTNFSSTDFNLGEDDTNTFESTDFSAGDIGADVELPDLDDLTGLDGDADLDTAETPDEIGDLDFSFDDDESETEQAEGLGIDDGETMDFELPEDLDLGSDSDDLSLSLDSDDIESTAVMEASTGVIDAASFIDQQDDDPTVDGEQIEATALMDLDDFAGLDEDDDMNFGMDDTAIVQPVSAEDIDSLSLDLSDFEDEEGDDDAISLEVDMDSDDSKTGTFAPGDFDDLDDLMVGDDDFDASGFDDIEDLMLPDDVDEVSTKLDLARAFIDMGDAEGARGSLDEVLIEGNDEQKAEAKTLLDRI